jgi:sigma-54 dependent transcriptional regulator, acetoin dehydrogenase operon transcriptional activator AcoR
VPSQNSLPSPSTGLLARLVERCAEPALLVERPGTVLLVNPAARRLLGGGDPAARRPLHELLGLGWRELEPIARDGASDVVVNLPPSRTAAAAWGAAPASVRVRTEAVFDGDGRVAAIVAFLDPPAGRSRATSRRELGLEAAPGDDPFAALYGDDPRLTAARELARRFAATSLPLLLAAETGTGKDLLARAIHRASPRAGGPFVAINCGGLSPHLLESELFGYGPGAFTGARREGNDGKAGAAGGGTLFLDEVAEMPAALQATLLRFLEDGTFYRIGENRLRRSDVRLICATCRDLPAMVADGSFRRDLFYRVNGACITLPPLRERSDLPALADHLLGQLAAHRLEPPPPLAADALEWLGEQPWPGNVRELRNALHHALILAGDEVRREHLPGSLEPPLRPPQAPVAAPPAREAAATAESLHAAERRAVRRALAGAGGNLTAAARSLGVARSTLYRLMERHGLGRDAAHPATGTTSG